MPNRKTAKFFSPAKAPQIVQESLRPLRHGGSVLLGLKSKYVILSIFVLHQCCPCVRLLSLNRGAREGEDGTLCAEPDAE